MALEEFENKITRAVEELYESVVTIRSIRARREHPFSSAPIHGAGSGFIVDSKGYVVTNYHVVEGAGRVDVVTKDGKAYSGDIIGADQETDVALIKIAGKGLHAAKLGDSEKLKVGQFALAIGNSLDMPGGATVSVGVVSALGRPLPWADFIFEGLVQTDAAINPGNSGGPLADSEGNVIGINTAMVPFAQGVGFAIPINTARWVMDQILKNGRVIRPALGISVLNMNHELAIRFGVPAESGVIVADVLQGGPADASGLRPGDIIQRIGGYEIRDIKGLLVALSKILIQKGVSVEFLRNGRRMEALIKPVERPIEN
jgi:S1-C subfamily serine protease